MAYLAEPMTFCSTRLGSSLQLQVQKTRPLPQQAPVPADGNTS